MARREAIWTATDRRDKGKKFKLKEMSANQAERWALRAFSALVRSGMHVEHLRHGGLEALFRLMQTEGFITALFNVPSDDLQDLADELLTCVSVLPDARTNAVERALRDEGNDGDDIEEIATRLKLRLEVLKLHSAFSEAEPLSTSNSETHPVPN
jgi:hypothetical protein